MNSSRFNNKSNNNNINSQKPLNQNQNSTDPLLPLTPFRGLTGRLEGTQPGGTEKGRSAAPNPLTPPTGGLGGNASNKGGLQGLGYKSIALSGAQTKFEPYISPRVGLPPSGGLGGRSNSGADLQQVVSITYEEIGLFPRSFNRVFDRFFKQLFFDVENLVIQEYRFYRYLFLTTVKCVFILLIVPLTVHFIAKNYFVRPITEYYWNTHQTEIFLNSYQQKRAFNELKNFEEKIYFESLILSNPDIFINSMHQGPHSASTFAASNSVSSVSTGSVVQSPISSRGNEKKIQSVSTSSVPQRGWAINQLPLPEEGLGNPLTAQRAKEGQKPTILPPEATQNLNVQVVENSDNFCMNKDCKQKKFSEIFTKSIQNSLQTETIELAKHYNQESIEAITNFFTDLISLITLFILLFRLEIQLNITKSFLLEVFFGLDDSKKSLCLLFVTDLLVGYHSPNIWELFFSSVFDRYGLPESQTTIFLLVATLPVLLDVLFKYLIFRHLNRASPATVATYHAMIE